jgi:hypothetical protein
MLRGAAVAVVVLLGAREASAAGAVEARFVRGRLEVQAQTAPLPQVLEAIARATGMKLVYERGVPRPLVTLRRSGETPSEAISAILDGLGLAFVVGLAPNGSDVATLMIVGSGAGSSSTTARDPGPAEVVEESSPFVADVPSQPAAAWTPPTSSTAERAARSPSIELAAEATGMRLGLPPSDIPSGAEAPQALPQAMGMESMQSEAAPVAGGPGRPPVAVPRSTTTLPPGMRQTPSTEGQNPPIAVPAVPPQ